MDLLNLVQDTLQFIFETYGIEKRVEEPCHKWHRDSSTDKDFCAQLHGSPDLGPKDRDCLAAVQRSSIMSKTTSLTKLPLKTQEQRPPLTQLPAKNEEMQNETSTKEVSLQEKKNKTTFAKEKSIEEILTSLNGSLKLLVRPATTYLVLFPEDQSFAPFLNNLAQAISDHFGSSLVVKVKNEQEWQLLLKTPYLKLLLVPKRDKNSSTGKDSLSDPCSLHLGLKTQDCSATVHSIDGKILYLAPLADYQKNIELKRDLWKILKSYFMPQLSSTPGSIKP